VSARSALAAALVGLAAAGCASVYKPCSQGGDVKWNPPVKGDMQCQQREDRGGRVVNHGRFRQHDERGKTLLEGEFRDGRRAGVWTQYNERGEKVAERYFENGVERAMPVGAADRAATTRP
jgi:hypothetical protein